MIISRVEKICTIVFVGLVFGLASSQVQSYDIFWQLNSGKYIWQNQSFIRTDIFTLAADLPRWEHCWLHDLFSYFVYTLFGFNGLSLLKGGIVAATVAALAGAAMVRGARPLAFLVIGAPAIFLTSEAWLDRPQLWTMLLCALFIYVLERYRRDGGKIIWLLPVLMVFWANLHAGAALGIAVAAAYLGGELIAAVIARRADWCRVKGLLLSWISLFAALLATPYGLTPLKLLLNVGGLGAIGGSGGGGGESFNFGAVYNYDWQGTTFAGFAFFYYAGAIALCLLLLCWKRIKPGDVLLLGGLWYMGNTLARHIPFFMLAAAAVLPLYADHLFTRLRCFVRPLRRPWVRWSGWGMALGLLFVFAFPVYARNGFFDVGFKAWHWPVGAAAFVKEQRLPGNLYNQYNYGEYLSWVLYPEYKVFFDSRQTSAELFKLGLQVGYGIIGWEKVLDDYGVNTIVMKACTSFPSERYPLLDRMAASSNWSFVYGDASSLVFVRNRAVRPDWLAQHALPKVQIYDTVLSEAKLLIAENPRRYNAYWEIAQVYWMKKKYQLCFDALTSYLALAPKVKPDAQKYYAILQPVFGKKE